MINTPKKLNSSQAMATLAKFYKESKDSQINPDAFVGASDVELQNFVLQFTDSLTYNAICRDRVTDPKQIKKICSKIYKLVEWMVGLDLDIIYPVITLPTITPKQNEPVPVQEVIVPTPEVEI